METQRSNGMVAMLSEGSSPLMVRFLDSPLIGRPFSASTPITFSEGEKPVKKAPFTSSHEETECAPVLAAHRASAPLSMPMDAELAST